MQKRITARHDPRLKARVIRRTPLYYRDGPDEALERPAYVRAGSSLTEFAGRYAVVQDDARFVALIALKDRRADCLPLPAGPGGHRLHDDSADHGRKDDKLDLEACMTVAEGGGPLLVAFGSGSNPQREHIVTILWRAGAEPEVGLHGAPEFYRALSDAHEFSGSELNVEGAVYLGGDRFRLFQRGNGEPRGGLLPVDATCDLSWPRLRAHLQNPGENPPPEPEGVMQYELGELDGLRLSFSDAEAVAGGTVLYSASAEGGGGAAEDGRIAGSVLGMIGDGGARWAELTAEDGARFGSKIEGLSADSADPYRVYFVVDDDAAERPSDIFEVELSGPWYERGG